MWYSRENIRHDLSLGQFSANKSIRQFMAHQKFPEREYEKRDLFLRLRDEAEITIGWRMWVVNHSIFMAFPARYALHLWHTSSSERIIFSNISQNLRGDLSWCKGRQHSFIVSLKLDQLFSVNTIKVSRTRPEKMLIPLSFRRKGV